MELKTPLYDIHVACGGRMVPFAGYLLPVQYETGVIAEHMAVRQACGLFDVSHMGEITCTGAGALENLNYLLANDFTGMKDGQARYSPMLNEEGGVVDDLIVYKVREAHYFLVVNAANKDKDFEWLRNHQLEGAEFQDISAKAGQIALQGPGALEILKKVAKEEEIPKKYYSAVFHGHAAGVGCVISRTGYTGEDGYELYMAAKDAPAVWNALMEAGRAQGLIPCGLGARDTLRLEAAMPLYGHEMDDAISPLEAGLGFAVKMGKEAFVGKEGVKGRGPVTKKRVGLKVTGRGILREFEDVFADGRKVGRTTSGTHCPYLNYPVAMALLDIDYAKEGAEVEVEVRGRRIGALVVPLPFYKREK